MDAPKVKKILELPEWLKELKLQETGIGIYCRVSTTEQRQLRSGEDKDRGGEKHPAFRQEHCDRNERHK